MVLFFNAASLILTVFLAWLYRFGIEHSLFWLNPWFDAQLHTLGGAVMGLWSSAVSVRMRFRPSPALGFFVAVGALASVVWELFEYALGLQGGLVDTFSDVTFNAVGIGLAFILYLCLRRL